MTCRSARPRCAHRTRAGLVALAAAISVLPSGIPDARAAIVAPPPRAWASMAYDASSGASLLFGGIRDGAARNDTWAWNGAGWQKRNPASRPPARHDAMMASDPDTKGVVLFGGQGGSADPAGNLNRADTWSWDGSVGTWSERSPAASPPARRAAVMAADKANGNVVLFGGFSGNVLTVCTPSLGDTWVWEGDAGAWTHASPATSPPPRYDAAMAYDGATGTVVLFGGVVLGERPSACGGESNDTWIWDGAARTWTEVTPPVSPSARSEAIMAYDKARNKVVLYGGYSPGGIYPTDTWLWDGVTRTWSAVETATSPGRITQAAMDYHGPSQKAVMFGGKLFGGELSGATWTWNGLKWRKW